HLAQVWDVARGRELVQLKGLDRKTHSAAFSPDGTRLVTASKRRFDPNSPDLSAFTEEKVARVWEVPSAKPEGVVATGKELLELKGHAEGVLAVAFSPDGKKVLTGSRDKTARLWDATTGKELQKFEGHASSVTSVAFSPDGKEVVTGSLDHNAR